ncbi:MAG: hypothetical protein A2Y41_11745 [Spirochaetes bacterium GWB1_36_13]|nr:MAG: hypothetical protein A2Y41_11745 [Spirochaetes bacterium GWB1_36_13]
MKTRNKLFITFGGTMFIILLLTGIVVYFYSKSQIIQIQEDNIGLLSQTINKKITAILDVSIKNHLRTFSQKTKNMTEYYYELYKKKQNRSEKEVIAMLRNIFLYPAFMKVGETGYLAGVKDDGTLLIHPASEGVNVSKAPFWQKVENILQSPEKEGYFEYEWKNKNEQQARKKVGYITYFEPLKLILWVSAYKSEFNSLVNTADFRDNLISIKLGETGFIYIIDNQGNALIHEKLEGKNLSDKPYIKKMLQEKNGKLHYLIEEEGKDYIAFFSYIPELDWIAVSGLSYDELMAPLFLLKIFIILGVLVAFIISLLISSMTGKLLAKKIEKFRHIFSVAEKGDLTQGYQSVSHKILQDEIDDMGLSFNQFLANYRELLMNLRNVTHKLLDLIQTLASSSQETSSTSNEQAAAVKEIVSTMEDLDILSKSIEKKINEIVNISTNTQKTVKNGFDKVQDTLKKMSEINDANRVTIDGIKFLSEKINNIWDIVNMINNIADQTKIIAFNAELEASSAGEAGKNFQIVAAEIRRLADSTVTSTREIKERITEIQKSSDRLILTSETGTEKIKEGNQFAKDIHALFEDVLSSSEISTESMNQIAKSIQQQVVTFEQVSIAIKQISEGADNIAVATREISGVTEDLYNVSETSAHLVSRYKIDATKESNTEKN